MVALDTRHHRWFCIALSVSVALGCAARREVGWQVEPAASGSASPEFEAARARAMQHWARRDNVAELRLAVTALEEAVRLNPADIATASLVSRAYYLLAENTEDQAEMLRLYEVGTQRGEQALAINPRFREHMQRNRQEEALRALGPEHVSALYWTAVNLGRWSRARGFTTVLANRRRIQQTVQRVTELDPTFFHGAPDRYWGAYYAIAPGFAGGDKEKSRQHFENALRIQPDYIGTRVAYAEIYAVSVQDRPLFEEQLRLAIETDVESLPDVVPEQKLEQAKARRFLARADELFAR